MIPPITGLLIHISNGLQWGKERKHTYPLGTTATMVVCQIRNTHNLGDCPEQAFTGRTIWQNASGSCPTMRKAAPLSFSPNDARTAHWVGPGYFLADGSQKPTYIHFRQ